MEGTYWRRYGRHSSYPNIEHFVMHGTSRSCCGGATIFELTPHPEFPPIRKCGRCVANLVKNSSCDFDMSQNFQERDWIADWNLDDWQQLDAATRQAWIERHLWRDPLEDEQDREAALRREDRRWRLEWAAKESYRLGRTVWDIGLEPLPFTVAMAQAIDGVRPEHGDGVVFLVPELRTRVLSALLANAGLRRAARLIPPELLRAQLDRDEQDPLRPITRPEFVQVDSDQYDHAYRPGRMKLDNEQQAYGPVQRYMTLYYLQLDDFTFARPEGVILRQAWDSETRLSFDAKQVEQVIEIAVRPSHVAFDRDVRAPAYLAAGAGDYRLVDMTDGVPEPDYDVDNFRTPWTIGHSPQWFWSNLTAIVGRFRDEVWAGTLFGSPQARDELLSLLIANVGLNATLELVPRRELWEAAL
jgi:hypothetical protein